MAKRAKGYYWVFGEVGAGFAWQIAFWNGYEWYLHGTSYGYSSDDFRRIGERIKRGAERGAD